MALSPKRRAFARKYAKNGGNGPQAYREAGYKGNPNVCRVEAHRLLTLPNVAAEIKRIVDHEVKADILSATDVLSGLSNKAKADIADVLEPDGSFSLAKAKERGKSKLIKSLKFDKDTGKVVSVELYSAHEAERDLGKFHKLFTERIESRDITAETKPFRDYLLQKIAQHAERSGLSEAESANEFRLHFSDKSSVAYDEDTIKVLDEICAQYQPAEVERVQ